MPKHASIHMQACSHKRSLIHTHTHIHTQKHACTRVWHINTAHLACSIQDGPQVQRFLSYPHFQEQRLPNVGTDCNRAKPTRANRSTAGSIQCVPWYLELLLRHASTCTVDGLHNQLRHWVAAYGRGSAGAMCSQEPIFLPGCSCLQFDEASAWPHLS